MYFWQLLEEKGVEAFESTVELIRSLKTAGIKAGIFSASRNAAAVLSAARVHGLSAEIILRVRDVRISLKGIPVLLYSNAPR